MLENFQLAAIVKQSAQMRLLSIPMHQELQTTLANTWQTQFNEFLNGAQEIDYDAGYQPEEHERFALTDFATPEWLSRESSATIATLEPIGQDEASVALIKGIAGFARDIDGNELVLFQNFNRSHVIKPGNFLLLRDGTYEATKRAGLTLDTKLAAVYLTEKRKFLFRNLRSVNSFFPLEDFYEEASERQICDILAHKLLAPVNVEAIVTESTQWVRKRFAMLHKTGVLNRYTAQVIQARSEGYDLEINLQDGRIVFPVDRPSVKKLLQFLNEELFRGAITETLYETNSKRAAD